jgi:hypothetical protein
MGISLEVDYYKESDFEAILNSAKLYNHGKWTIRAALFKIE